MLQHAADLGAPTLAANARHEPGQHGGIGGPFRGAALAEAAEIDELHVQPADASGLREHVALDLERHVPAVLAAHGGVHGKHEPTVAGARSRCWQIADAGKEGLHVITLVMALDIRHGAQGQLGLSSILRSDSVPVSAKSP